MKKHRVNATGVAIIVKALAIEEKKSTGGIVIKTTLDESRQIELQCLGEVVSIGESAFADRTLPACKIGDKIYFLEHGARMFKRELEDEVCPLHRFINDVDVIGVVEEYETDE